jgi:hypothetical protein
MEKTFEELTATEKSSLGVEELGTADNDWGLDSGWTIGSGILSYDGSTDNADATHDGGTIGNFPLVQNTLYKATFTISSSGTGQMSIRCHNGSTISAKESYVSGTYTRYVVETAHSGAKFEFRGDADGDAFDITSYSVKAVTHDLVSYWALDDEIISSGTGFVYDKVDETLGSELITNGTFDTDTTGWTDSTSTIDVVSGEIEITSTGGNRPQANQTITTVVGKSYLISAYARRGTCAGSLEIEIAGISASSSGSTTATTSTYIYEIFTAVGTSSALALKIDDGSSTAGETAYFDNVSVKEYNGNVGELK